MITLFRQKATKKPPQKGRKIVFFTNYFFGKIHNKNHHRKQTASFVLQCKLRCGRIIKGVYKTDELLFAMETATKCVKYSFTQGHLKEHFIRNGVQQTIETILGVIEL